jgi:hypothetical protein
MNEADFTRLMTERANAHRDAMRGMSEQAAMKYVRQIIADNDVVVGVWQEPTARYKVGIHVIKGRQRLEAIMAARVAERLRSDAVPCIELEQAVAAEQVFDDKAN